MRYVARWTSYPAVANATVRSWSLSKAKAISVVGVAIGFNHDLLGWPEEIDEVRPDENVDFGNWNGGLATQRQEIDLQLRPSVDRAWVDFHRDATQATNPLPSTTASNQTLERGPIDSATPIGRNQRALLLLRAESTRHIEQRSLYRRNRNTPLLGHLLQW
jgi:hypothetical protein